MSWQAVTWVLEQSQATLGSRLVLLSIASHANREGHNSWPAVETICLETRLSRREVQYCLRQLEELGELKTRAKRGRPNMYDLPLVTTWLGAQDLRVSKSLRGAQTHSTVAHPIAHEPFKAEPSKEREKKNLSFPVSLEPSKSEPETLSDSEENSIRLNKVMRGTQKAMRPERAHLSAAELEQRRQLLVKQAEELKRKYPAVH